MSRALRRNNRSRELDRIYTIEEYKKLYEMYASNFFFVKRIACAIEGKTMYYRMGNRVIPFKYLSDLLFVTAYRTFKVLFELPLADMPLYINTDSITIQGIIKWRLMIGK